MKFEAKNR
jgi:hypothetical protein